MFSFGCAQIGHMFQISLQFKSIQSGSISKVSMELDYFQVANCRAVDFL